MAGLFLSAAAGMVGQDVAAGMVGQDVDAEVLIRRGHVALALEVGCHLNMAGFISSIDGWLGW